MLGQVPDDHGGDHHGAGAGQPRQARITFLAHAHRGLEGLLGIGRVLFETGDRHLGADAEGLGVGPHIADGEGPRGQLVDVHFLDRLQVRPAHAGGFGNVVECQILGLAQRTQRLPDAGPRAQQRLQPVSPLRSAILGALLGVGPPADIQWHGSVLPRRNRKPPRTRRHNTLSTSYVNRVFGYQRIPPNSIG